MKKILIATIALVAVMSATACSNSSTPKTTAEETTVAVTTAVETTIEKSDDSPEFSDENGVLTYLDVTASPFDGAGLRITADTTAKTVNFLKTDLDGNDTVEYYTFNYNTNTVEQYYYVSMMGTGFYYTYDLTAGEIVKIEDADHNDSTQSTKDSGRFDGANERLRGDVAVIEQYFTDRFGKSISEMVN